MDENNMIFLTLMVLAHVIWTERRIGFECQIFVIVIFFNCCWHLQFGAHSSYYKGALTQKKLIFSALYYFQIWFSCRLKKSKQTFKTKFVIQRSVQMTWTRQKERKFQNSMLRYFEINKFLALCTELEMKTTCQVHEIKMQINSTTRPVQPLR
jgi:hypothetical protein